MILVLVQYLRAFVTMYADQCIRRRGGGSSRRSSWHRGRRPSRQCCWSGHGFCPFDWQLS